jgi:SP family myo-inositol transporter-like MFS transporter 13
MSSLENASQSQSGDVASKTGKAEHIDDVDFDDIEKVGMANTITDVATSVDNIPISWFVWLVAATASMAGLLFGYDTGIISAALVYLNNDLDNRPVTSNEKELITSLCSGGAFFGAIFAGITADRVRSSFHILMRSQGFSEMI